MSRTEREEVKARAEARFKKQHGLSDTVATAREVADREQADAAAKTERLRAMRLAEEQSDQTAAEVRKLRREP